MCLKGSSIGALSALPYAMAADVIDLDSAQTGKRQGGAYFSIWTMTRKLAYALGLVVGTTAAVGIGFAALAGWYLWLDTGNPVVVSLGASLLMTSLSISFLTIGALCRLIHRRGGVRIEELLEVERA